LTRFEQFAARIRALLSADTDQALVRARTDGEKLIGVLRVAFILFFSIVALGDLSSRQSWRFELFLISASLLYGLAMLFLAIRVASPWVPWFTTTIDVSLVTAALVAFVVAGYPLAAVNNRSYFDTYFFIVITSTLRYDWRLAAFAASLALAQFVGLTAYVGAHWNLDELKSDTSGSFAPVAHALRLLILGAVGVSSVAVARWARHLRLMVGTDHLTGLSQRRPFFERLEEELERATSTRATLSIALFDVDEFKKFNDTFGHLSGDRALQLLAGRLRKSVRSSDLVARYGGEEFVVAFPRMDVARALRRADELRVELAQVPVLAGGAVRHLTLSVGVASWPADGESFEEVLGAADKRLYQAKNDGRNRVCGPPPALKTAADG
jgi:diguanylate cyclase (GGDEF)-like protein